MRLGRVGFTHYYVVDLDDETMVADAEECVLEDLLSGVKYDQLCDGIGVIEENPELKEEDIPEFLLRNGDEVIEYLNL